MQFDGYFLCVSTEVEQKKCSVLKFSRLQNAIKISDSIMLKLNLALKSGLYQGKPTFAAVCMEVCYADFSDIGGLRTDGSFQ